MADFPATEFFGFPIEDTSDIARHFRDNRICPFIDGPCTKLAGDGTRLGTCSMRRHEADPVIICPRRFWEGEELPALIARETQPGGGLLVVPEVGIGLLGRLDWALAAVDGTGEPTGTIYGVEAQAVDTTGSLRPYVEAYFEGRDWTTVSHQHGINWRNVFKRIVPQILAKGRLFEAQHSRLYVIMQDVLVDYLKSDMRMEAARPGEDANVIFYAFKLSPRAGGGYDLAVTERFRTTLRHIERAMGDVAGLPSGAELAAAVKARITETGIHLAPGGVPAVGTGAAEPEPVQEGHEAEE